MEQPTAIAVLACDIQVGDVIQIAGSACPHHVRVTHHMTHTDPFERVRVYMRLSGTRELPNGLEPCVHYLRPVATETVQRVSRAEQ